VQAGAAFSQSLDIQQEEPAPALTCCAGWRLPPPLLRHSAPQLACAARRQGAAASHAHWQPAWTLECLQDNHSSLNVVNLEVTIMCKPVRNAMRGQQARAGSSA
jgi:hypothetical protein